MYEGLGLKALNRAAYMAFGSQWVLSCWLDQLKRERLFLREDGVAENWNGKHRRFFSLYNSRLNRYLAAFTGKSDVDLMSTDSNPRESRAETPQDDDFLQGQALRTALGFRTGEAFRAAIRARRITVPLVKIAGRRGWFARAKDVAEWRASVGKDFDQAAKGITS